MRGNRVGTRLLRTTVLVLAIALVAPAAAEEKKSDGAAVPGGMRVHIDPETGERVSAPPVEAAQRSGVSEAPAAGLVEEVNPQGGYVIHLQRRFRGAMAAHVDDAGKVGVGCETGAAAVSE